MLKLGLKNRFDVVPFYGGGLRAEFSSDITNQCLIQARSYTHSSYPCTLCNGIRLSKDWLPSIEEEEYIFVEFHNFSNRDHMFQAFNVRR